MSRQYEYSNAEFLAMVRLYAAANYNLEEARRLYSRPEHLNALRQRGIQSPQVPSTTTILNVNQRLLDHGQFRAPKHAHGRGRLNKSVSPERVELKSTKTRAASVKCRNSSNSPLRRKNKSDSNDSLTFLESAEGTEDGEANGDLPCSTDVDEEQTDPLEKEVTVEPPDRTEQPKPEPPRILMRKRRRIMPNFESRLVKIIQNKINSYGASKNSSPLQDDDQSFFNSLAPIINNFDASKKLAFRSKILKLVVEVGELGTTVKQEQLTFYLNE